MFISTPYVEKTVGVLGDIKTRNANMQIYQFECEITEYKDDSANEMIIMHNFFKNGTLSKPSSVENYV